MGAIAIKPTIAHTVDTLAHVIGRDQPIMAMEKALEMVALLGEEVFTDENVVFFDPFCKAGELLLACAFHSCWAKSKGKAKLLDVDMVMKEIYQSNRYFGLAPDERHHRLSIRTFLGNENSHKEEFNHIIRDGHYLSEQDGTLDKEKFEKEFKSMIEYINSKTKNKKIIAVGNPPYQENDGGGNGTSAKPIYNIFTNALIQSDSIKNFMLVIPSRWFVGGKGLDSFRDYLLQCNKIKAIYHFEKSGEVFPTVDIDGGVCFLNFDKEHNGNVNFISDENELILNLNEWDAIPDDPKSVEILIKIKEQYNGVWMNEIAKARNYFGISSDFFKKNVIKKSTNNIPCITRNKELKSVPKDILKNTQDIDKYKVCIPKAYGGKKGDRRITMPARSFFIVPPGTIVSETYSILGLFDKQSDAQNMISWLTTDIIRYLLGLRKLTQNISRDTWGWVPYLNVKKKWTDDLIKKELEITESEFSHIKKKVQEWS